MARATSAALVSLISFCVPAISQSHHAGELTLEPYSFRTYDGSAHPAELGHLWVPASRSNGSGGLLQIAFVRIRSTASKPRPPVVFLPGGPGIPATAIGRVPVYYELFEKLQAHSDVILLDQRGIGMSVPNTQCPEGQPPPPDVFVKETAFREALIAGARACAEYWRAKGFDPASLTTAASADDLEDLRSALGAAKISLLAHSYGTSLALDALRRHGEHLDRVVLAGVEGPDQGLPMPLAFDLALRRLSALAAAAPKLLDAFPDTYREFQQVLEQVGKEPLTMRIRNPRTKEELPVKVGPFVLQFAVKSMLPNGQRVGRIPALVYSLAHGDSSLLTGAVQDLYNGMTSGFTAMQFAVSCSEGSSASRRQLAREQASHSVFGDAPFIHLDPGVCEAVGAAAPSADSLLPVWSSVPTLLIDGTLDSNTPDYQAAEVLWGLENGASVTVENGFHETLPSPDVQAAAAGFLNGAHVLRQVIEWPAPEFLTMEEARAPQRPAR